MAYDYAKLNGRITEKFKTQIKFAEKIGLSQRSLSLKLNNKIPFKQPEIAKAIALLDIPEEEIKTYFFKLKVQSN